MLEVRLLGQFELRLDGAAQALPSRPAQNLLAYLVLHAGTPHRREHLAGLLWADHPETAARRNLRTALWHVRKVLGGATGGSSDYILAGGINIAFNAQSKYWLDTAALEAASGPGCTTGELMERVSLYRGELLPGFYEDWAVLERERLDLVFESTMQRLVRRLLLEQRWSDALAWSRRWIALGHAVEPAYRALMVAHACLGDTASAADAYRRCRAALSEELGVEPSTQTVRLYKSLVSGESPSGLIEQAVAGMPAEPAITANVTAAVAAPAPGDPPFQGLRYFDEADAPLFFGRESLVARLMARLERDPSLLVVVGASGSGKSSLLRAGLVPAVRRGRVGQGGRHARSWRVRVMTPTARPLEALAVALAHDADSVKATLELIDALAHNSRSLVLAVQHLLRGDAERILLVVDQLEELFTLCQDEAERRAFVDNLITASHSGLPLTLVLALRADFYAHCGEYPGLREALAEHQEYIGPMSPDELRQVVEGPVRQGGWLLSPGLVDVILRDAGEEPGALPLLSHALLETWQRREGRAMTLAGYSASGGVRGAIATTAEKVYQGLSPDEQVIVRGAFLRLTALGEGTQDTRRRVKIAELIPTPELGPVVRHLLGALAGARLITLGDDTVEVAHEALIREWPALRRWLAEDREGLRLHRRLTLAAQEWEELARDPSVLYRGTLLAQASDWAEAHGSRLNAVERDFLAAAQEHSAADAARREAQRLRELEGSRRLARAESESEQQRRLAIARELAAAAVSDVAADPERSILLAMEAIDATYLVDGTWTVEAETALHRALSRSRVLRTLRPENGASLWGLSYSPDGLRLATAADDGRAIVWDVATGEQVLTLVGHQGRVKNLAFGPDGTRIATCSFDTTVRVWDARTGQLLQTLAGHKAWVANVAFHPDGRMLASAGADGLTYLWDLVSGKPLLALARGAGGAAGVAFSPDGRLLAGGAGDYTARIWDVATGEERAVCTGHGQPVSSVAFSPDGARLVTGGLDRTAKVWDVTTGRHLVTLLNHINILFGVRFSPDGSLILTASNDATARVWDAASGRELFSLAGHEKLVADAAFSPDGNQIATVSADGSARIWTALPPAELPDLTAPAGQNWDVAVSGDGKQVATAGSDGMARVWDMASGTLLHTLPAGHDGAPQFAVAFSPDGQRLATSGQDREPAVWDLQTGERALALTGHAEPLIPDAWLFVGIQDITYSPDGALLATAGADATARLWDASSGRQLSVLEHPMKLNSVRFSPDGKRLATGGDDFTAKIWDVASGELLATLRGHGLRVWSAVFSPDGRRLATAGQDTTAKIWDLATGEEILTLKGHSSTVACLAYSPDGSRLVTVSDAAARIWDTSDGRELLTIYAGNTAFWGAAFHPDGKRLVVADLGGFVHQYTLQIDDLMRLARGRVTRGLTPAELRRYLHAP